MEEYDSGRSIRRRRLLAAVCTGPVAAGCLSREERPTFALGRVEIQNRSTQPVDVVVTITRDGEERYRERRSYEAAEFGVEHPTFGGEVLAKEWFGTTDEYEISVATVDGRFEATASTADAQEKHGHPVEGDAPDGLCFSFYVMMGVWGEDELGAIRIGTTLIRQNSTHMPYADGCQVVDA
ncbi:hypothetical protein [Halovivax asiaticus]|uniref:hypothetical protein n=1 Tax=Halovivax asiaticus TaxID=332953 RepID=UPI0012672867|nr:hypothetical protein [Halovivax asiaticus]